MTQDRAILAFKGFSQIYSNDFDEILAPIAKYYSFISLTVSKGTVTFHVLQFNIREAFLNGILKEELYVEFSYRVELKHFGNCYQRKEALYGLKDTFFYETRH